MMRACTMGIVLCGWAAGCDSSGSLGSTGVGAASGAAVGAGPGVGSVGVGGTFPGECRLRFPAVVPTLASGDALEIDADITCQNIELGAEGLSVILDETRTIVSSSGGDGETFELTPGMESHTLTGLERHVRLLVASDFAIFVQLGLFGIEFGVGEIHAWWGEGGFLNNFRVDDPNDARLPTLLDAAMTRDGVMRAWYTKGTDVDTVLTSTYDFHDIDFVPRFEVTPISGAIGRLRFSLTERSETVVFNATPTVGELLAQVGSDAPRVLRAPGGRDAGDFRLARPAQGFESSTDFAGSILDDDGLHVVSANVPELTLPGVARWRGACESVPMTASGCPTTCHENAIGVMPQAHAIALLPGDAVVLVYVEQHADVELALAPSADGTTCAATPGEDDLRHDLVAVRVHLSSGAVAEHLRVAIPRFPDVDEVGGGAIDVATHAYDAAIAVRVAQDDAWRIRTTRFALAP